ncbi:MAG: DUF2007 domain-containing protein [Bacteroidota bacterium]|nr:DUF2007 domain-containing protein [Bacteroidota bacterium]
MDKDWIVIYSTTEPYKAEMLHSLLEMEEIESVVVNKKDSSYLMFGEVEVYVNRENLLKAKGIVKRYQENE